MAKSGQVLAQKVQPTQTSGATSQATSRLGLSLDAGEAQLDLTEVLRPLLAFGLRHLDSAARTLDAVDFGLLIARIYRNRPIDALFAEVFAGEVAVYRDGGFMTAGNRGDA